MSKFLKMLGDYEKNRQIKMSRNDKTIENYFKGLKIMNKEQQELLGEAYMKYQNQTMFHTDDLMSLKESDGMNMSTGEKTKVYRQFALVEFINKCKTDTEFSEKWGLKIEERELSLEERFQLWKPSGKFEHFQKQYSGSHNRNNPNKLFDTFDIPTKLITITYNNKTIESYE